GKQIEVRAMDRRRSGQEKQVVDKVSVTEGDQRTEIGKKQSAHQAEIHVRESVDRERILVKLIRVLPQSQRWLKPMRVLQFQEEDLRFARGQGKCERGSERITLGRAVMANLSLLLNPVAARAIGSVQCREIDPRIGHLKHI